MSLSTYKSTPNVASEPIRDKEWIMPFGKWKGETLGTMMFDDPQYILWLQENTDLDFHHTIIDECEQHNEQEYEDQSAYLESFNYPDFWKD